MQNLFPPSFRRKPESSSLFLLVLFIFMYFFCEAPTFAEIMKEGIFEFLKVPLSRLQIVQERFWRNILPVVPSERAKANGDLFEIGGIF